MAFDDEMREGERGEVIQAMPLKDVSTGVITITNQIIIEMDGVASIRITTDAAATYDITSNELRHYSIGIDIDTVEVLTGTVRIA